MRRDATGLHREPKPNAALEPRIPCAGASRSALAFSLGNQRRFTDSAWEQVIPWSEKPICPLKKLNTSANPPAARPSGRAGSR
jgi:hypothetical protein